MFEVPIEIQISVSDLLHSLSHFGVMGFGLINLFSGHNVPSTFSLVTHFFLLKKIFLKDELPKQYS